MVKYNISLHVMQRGHLFFCCSSSFPSFFLPGDKPGAVNTRKMPHLSPEHHLLESELMAKPLAGSQEGADITSCLMNVKWNLLGLYLSRLYHLFQPGKSYPLPQYPHLGGNWEMEIHFNRNRCLRLDT